MLLYNGFEPINLPLRSFLRVTSRIEIEHLHKRVRGSRAAGVVLDIHTQDLSVLTEHIVHLFGVCTLVDITHEQTSRRTRVHAFLPVAIRGVVTAFVSSECPILIRLLPERGANRIPEEQLQSETCYHASLSCLHGVDCVTRRREFYECELSRKLSPMDPHRLNVVVLLELSVQLVRDPGTFSGRLMIRRVYLVIFLCCDISHLNVNRSVISNSICLSLPMWLNIE